MTRQLLRQDGTLIVLILGGLLLLPALTGCGSTMAELKKDNTALEGRVTELERANRGLQVRLDAYEASMTLVEDQVRALEIARRGAERTKGLDVVRLEPEHDDSVYQTAEPQGYRDEDQYEDIVVTDEKMEKYFGAHSKPAASASSSGGRGSRAPKAPVVSGDKLSVVPMKGNAAPSDPIDLYKAGLKEYRQEKFEPAIELFSSFLDSDPPQDYVDNALYWLGECHYGLGDYAQAATFFHRIVEEFPDANKVPDALLKVGLTYQRLEKGDSAREVLHYLIEAYPDSQAAKVARKRLDSLGAS